MSSGMKPMAPAKATRPEPAGKEMPMRETGMGVAAGADGVGQQQAVQPGMDDAVAGLQGNAAPFGDERGQVLVHLDVGRLGIGRGVAE